jgi:hypothetical protein
MEVLIVIAVIAFFLWMLGRASKNYDPYNSGKLPKGYFVTKEAEDSFKVERLASEYEIYQGMPKWILMGKAKTYTAAVYLANRSVDY